MKQFSKITGLVAILLMLSQGTLLFAAQCQIISNKCDCQHKCADGMSGGNCCQIKAPQSLPTAILPIKSEIYPLFNAWMIVPAQWLPSDLNLTAIHFAISSDSDLAPPILLTTQNLRL